jgi:hypothetical protein
MVELSLANSVLVGVLVLGSALLGLGVAKLSRPRSGSSEQGWRRFPRSRGRWARRGGRSMYGHEQSARESPWAASEPDLTDSTQQLKVVMAAEFQRRQVLSVAEFKAFRVIEREVTGARKGYRVFAQTSLGQLLRCTCPKAFASINSKRTDIMVFDQAGWPVLAVEYQGDGHYQGDGAARDAVKKEALRKAGVAYVEIFNGDTDDQIRYRVREKLGWNTPASPNGGGAPPTNGPDRPPINNLRAVEFAGPRARAWKRAPSAGPTAG